LTFTGTVVNQPSSDAWQVLSCPSTVRLTFNVLPPKGATTGGIVYQLGRSIPATVWEDDDQPLPPGMHTRERRVDAVRFKSLVPGKPAIVSIETATAEQVGARV
jgi:hypothetical protein